MRKLGKKKAKLKEDIFYIAMIAILVFLFAICMYNSCNKGNYIPTEENPDGTHYIWDNGE